jgi:tetratricopeptide (TPR) repeat protein
MEGKMRACSWLVALSAWAFAAYAQPTENGWQHAASLLAATENDVKSSDITAVERHRQELESALATAHDAIAAAAAHNMELTDGGAERIMALSTAAFDKSKAKNSVHAVQNPYPAISLYLGSYYDEVGKPADAIRVIDLGLATFSTPDTDLGAHVPILLGERGAALNMVHRSEEALASYERALKIPDLPNLDRARLERGRGFSLTELNRLDDAEAAYQESLKLEPGNERAQHEVNYIAQLKSGSVPTKGYLATVKPGQPATAPATTPSDNSKPDTKP